MAFPSINMPSIFEDAFGYQTSLKDHIEYLFSQSNSANKSVLTYFYKQLYNDFNPDITGYTLIFMVPPDLSGYRIKYGTSVYGQDDPSSQIGEITNFVTFAAIDFTPPQSQVNSDTVKARSGGMPYATEVAESEQCSITFIDNSNLDIYTFHHLWIEYIREILDGSLSPSDEYITENNDKYRMVDYFGSIYVVKYFPNMKDIKFVAKCTGVFPQALPSKEIIGNRTTNELTTIPFTYFCTNYRECLLNELRADSSFWILKELNNQIYSRFNGGSAGISDQGILNNIVNGVLGPVSAVTNTINSTMNTLNQSISSFKIPNLF